MATQSHWLLILMCSCSAQDSCAQVEPVLQAMEDVLGSLTQTLDGRVYVAMGRGLWDFTAREIYEYADELAESKENQVCPACGCPCLLALRTDAYKWPLSSISQCPPFHNQAMPFPMRVIASSITFIPDLKSYPDCTQSQALCSDQILCRSYLSWWASCCAGSLARQTECSGSTGRCGQFLHSCSERHPQSQPAEQRS